MSEATPQARPDKVGPILPLTNKKERGLYMKKAFNFFKPQIAPVSRQTLNYVIHKMRLHSFLL